jgi:hypothetical protein
MATKNKPYKTQVTFRINPEWPRPAVFVATASGDGYFVEMGTVHSPARLFLSQALDSTVGQFNRIMKAQGTP